MTNEDISTQFHKLNALALCIVATKITRMADVHTAQKLIDKYSTLLTNWQYLNTTEIEIAVSEIKALKMVAQTICDQKKVRLVQLDRSHTLATLPLSITSNLTPLFANVQFNNTTNLFITSSMNTLAATPATLNISFGTVLRGGERTIHTLQLCNQSNTTVRGSISKLDSEDASAFELLSVKNFSILASQTFFVDVVLKKQEADKTLATSFVLQFTGLPPVPVNISATVQKPEVDIITTQLDFGNVCATSTIAPRLKLAVRNKTGVPLTLKAQIQSSAKHTNASLAVRLTLSILSVILICFLDQSQHSNLSGLQSNLFYS